MELRPQEREVIRRLLYRLRLQSGSTLVSVHQWLPKRMAISADQQRLLQSLGQQMRQGKQAEIDALWDLDYRHRPPTIAEFIDDDYYLGSCLRRSPSNEGLWPVWRAWLIEHADLDSFLHNLVITGAIGIGKSLVMTTLMLYRICLCASLRDPYAFFGLSRGSPISFLMLSLSLQTLRMTSWRTALRLLGGSPFFREICGYDSSRTYAGMEILLRVNADTLDEVRITLAGGSKAQHQVGQNVLMAAIDEGNFRLEKDPHQYASELFTDCQARIVSRFQQIGGFVPGLTIVASSASDESSFTERLIDQIRQSNDVLGQTVVRSPIYLAKPGLKLCSWHFKVSYGLSNVEPAVLKGCYSAEGQPIMASSDCPSEMMGPHEPAASAACTELVPGNYDDDFVRSPWKALQHHSGISLGSTHRLFPSLADIERCLAASAEEGVPTPTQATVLSVSDENQSPIGDALVHKSFVCRVERRFQPIRHPARLRYMHIDLATSGLAGLAICHLVDPTLQASSGESSSNTAFRLVVEYDFILTIAGGKTRPVSLEKIVNFISL